MKTLAPRDLPEAEAPFRAPEQLALAMPLIAVSGLIVVVSAVALGATGPIVALVAVGGFGLCALAPMALIEAFVNRPLRGALAQLRAARDGHGERGPIAATGVLADLVHIARDLQAARTSVGPPEISPFETLVAASEEAARALRDQAGSVAEAAADGESQINRAAQACFADIARAIQSLRDAPVATGFDGAVERLESMLVYIAEAQERAEAKDRQFEGAFSRMELGVADVARLVARETDTLQASLSSGGLSARGDIAEALAQVKSGRARVAERLDALETRLTKTADGVTGEVARLAEVVRTESRRPAAADGRLDDIAAALTRVEAETARPAIGEELRALGTVVARLSQDFSSREPVDAALRGVSETLAAGFKDADLAGLRAEVRETAAVVAAFRIPPGLDRSDLAAALSLVAANLSRQLADIGARLEAFGRNDEALGLVEAARGLIETSARFEAQERASGSEIVARLDALGAGVDESLAALGRQHAQTTQDAMRQVADAMTPEAWERIGAEVKALARVVEAREAPEAFPKAADDLVARRLEGVQAQLAAQGEDARKLAETVESALAEVAARTETASRRHQKRLDDFADETIDPAREALAGAAKDFAAFRTKFEADGLASVVEATLANLVALSESLPRAFAETAEAQGERLAARLDAAVLAPARAAFAQSAEGFTAAQARLAEAVTRLEAGDPRFASETEAIRSQLDGLAAAMRAQAENFASRLEAAALHPARDALAQATESFDAAQGRLAAAVETIKAGDPRLAALARATQALPFQISDLVDTRLDALARTVQAQAQDLATRIDAAALAPAREALARSADTFDAAQGRLAVAVEKIEAGDPRLAGAMQALPVQIGDLVEARIGALARTMQAQADDLAARVEAAALAPAREALALSAESFVAAQTRLAGAVEKIEAGDPRLASAMQALPVQIGDLVETRIGALARTMQAQADDLAARVDAAALTPARDAFTQTVQSFAAAQACLAGAVATIEASKPHFADAMQALPLQIGDLVETRFGALALTMRAQADALASRVDAAALRPARDALAQAAQDFAAAEARLDDAVGRIEAGDARVAGIVGATGEWGSRIGELAEALRAQGDDFAARLDASALTPARQAFVQASQSFDAAQTRLTQAVERVEAGDPGLGALAETTKALRAEFAAWAQKGSDALAERSAAALAPAREALTDAAREFEAARSRLDEGAEGLARLRGDFVASEARFGRMFEETVARMAALGFERLPELVGDLAATQAQWRIRLGEFDRSAAVLAGLGAADTRAVAELRDAFAEAEQTLLDAVAGLPPVVEAAAAAQGDRIVQAMNGRDHADAVKLGEAIASLTDLHARPQPATVGLEGLRADLAASAQSVASRFDEAAQALARRIEERLDSLRRGDFAPAALALQASTQDLGKAHAELFGQVDALKAALAGDRSAFAALRQDLVEVFASVANVGERTDSSLRDAAQRTETLAARVGDLAGAERDELAALAQALSRIGERVEYAARAFEERRGGDLVTLGADLTRDIDALARATAERVLALEGGVETLAHAAGATLTQVREATRAFSGLRLEPLADLKPLTQDLRAFLAQTSEDWRPALDKLGARLAQALGAVERRLQARIETPAGPVAKLVVTMADALDARFSQIEAGLDDLTARLAGGEADGASLEGDVAALAGALRAASQDMKTSLSDFAAVSAALADEAAGETQDDVAFAGLR